MEDKKTLAFLCDYKSLYGGNFIPSLLKIEEIVNELGYKVVYMFPREARDRYWFKYLEDNKHVVIPFDFKQNRHKLLLSLNSIVNNYNISIIHAHFGQMLNLEIYSYINRRIKIIIHIHSDFTSGYKNIKERVTNKILYQLMAKRVHFISVSRAFVNYNPQRIIWIPNGLATNRIPSRCSEIEDIRQKHNIKENEVLCELFGWSPIVKGVDIGVKAVVRANTKSDKRVLLAIVCGREYTQDKMRSYIIEKVGITPDLIDKYIKFLNPIEDVYSYHKCADILLSTSRSEGFPYSILEMLSLGKKCVISRIPGTSWAEKYSTVRTFESENVEDCSNAIVEAIKLSDVADESVAHNIFQSYSIERWAEQVVSCYGIN